MKLKAKKNKDMIGGFALYYRKKKRIKLLAEKMKNKRNLKKNREKQERKQEKGKRLKKI